MSCLIHKEQRMDYGNKVLKGPVQNDDVDRISQLPNSLLCHILSLVPTKESAATSILSKRWKHLFALVPDIDLEYTHSVPPDDGNDGDVTDKGAPDKPFLDFIKLCNRMILLRNGVPIRKFNLSLRGINERCHLIFESMMSGALVCQIQEVDVHIEHMKYSVRNCPPGIFTCETLVVLKVSWRRSMNPGLPNTVSLPNLQVLCLDFMLSLYEGSAQRLILGCPKLEELFLKFAYCRNHEIDKKKKRDHVLDFSSPSIRKLALDFCGGDEEVSSIIVGSHNLESLDYRLHGESNARVIVNAPNLKHLACQASMATLMNFVDSSLNCLVSAKIPMEVECFFEAFGEAEIEHLLRVRNVQSLCLGEHILRALHGFRHLLPTFKNLRRLELEFIKERRMNHIYAWQALPILLDSAPNLEALIFDHVIWNKSSEEHGGGGVESLVEAIFPVRFIEKLKEIEIRGFDNVEYELKLVEHLLENGKALKKIRIGEAVEPSSCSRISSFKRCSHHCQIVFGGINANA